MKKRENVSLVFMVIVMLIAGSFMWITAWIEVHNNARYGWEKPYTIFEARVISMKWMGVVLLVYGLISAGLLAYKILQADEKKHLNPIAAVKQNDVIKPKKRTTIKIPMQTNQIHTVQRIIEKVLEPEGYEQKIIAGETVWVKGEETDLLSQRFKTAFAEKTLIIQGWTDDAFLGEMNLDGASTGKEPEKEMYLLIRKIYAVIKRGNF